MNEVISGVPGVGMSFSLKLEEAQKYYNNNWLKRNHVPMRRKPMKRRDWLRDHNMYFDKSSNANVLCLGLNPMGEGKPFAEKLAEIRRNESMKNEMNTTDQMVVTEKENILIEKQEATAQCERLAAYGQLLRK